MKSPTNPVWLSRQPLALYRSLSFFFLLFFIKRVPLDESFYFLFILSATSAWMLLFSELPVRAPRREHVALAFVWVLIPFAAVGFKSLFDRVAPNAAGWSIYATYVFVMLTVVVGAWLALGSDLLAKMRHEFRYELRSGVKNHPGFIGYVAFAAGLCSAMAASRVCEQADGPFPGVAGFASALRGVLIASLFLALFLSAPFYVAIALRPTKQIPDTGLKMSITAVVLGCLTYLFYVNVFWPWLLTEPKLEFGWLAGGYFVLIPALCSELWRRVCACSCRRDAVSPVG